MKKARKVKIYLIACVISSTISVLSLLLSTYLYEEMFLGYFENILIFALNTFPIIFLFLMFYFITKREWLSYLISALIVLGGGNSKLL